MANTVGGLFRSLENLLKTTPELSEAEVILEGCDCFNPWDGLGSIRRSNPVIGHAKFPDAKFVLGADLGK